MDDNNNETNQRRSRKVKLPWYRQPLRLFDCAFSMLTLGPYTRSFDSSSSTESLNDQTSSPLILSDNTEEPFFKSLPFFDANYEFLGFLGRGSFGKVIKARHKLDEKIYAIKCIPLDRLDEKHVIETKEEVEFLSSLVHKYVVSYKTSWIDSMKELPHCDDGTEESSFSVSEDNYVHYGLVRNSFDARPQRQWLCIKMEYCETSLEHVIRTNGYKESKEKLTYFWQMVKGLAYVHSKRLIHRDLKPANILVDGDNCVRIADFGLACEKCTSDDGTYKYSENDDMKDLGVILNEMFGGVLPLTEDCRCNSSEELREANFLFQWLKKPCGERPSCDDLLTYHNAFSNKIRRFNEACSQSV